MELYRDRARAESFGSIAEQYDYYRPAYPDALIDDLVAAAGADRPVTALDLACGTGKVSRALAKRGVDVLGVELDPRMADVARAHGVPVEIGAVETWAPAGRRFDLVTCGDAWHWIDPEQGFQTVSAVLPPGAPFARFWNFQRLDDDVLKEIDAVYVRYAPDAVSHGRPPEELPAGDTADGSLYHWDKRYTADEWVGLAATYSDHQRLGPERLTVLRHALRATIETLGGTVTAHGGTFAVITRRG